MTLPSTAATTASIVTPDTFVDAVLKSWSVKNKKAALRPGPTVSGLEAPFPLVSSPTWPGTGDVATVTDHIPIVTIDEMPATEYPKFLVPLAAYTLAEMLLQQPELTIARSSSALSRLVTLVVAARVGSWAALGCVPIHSPNASSIALRWSTSNSTIIVKAGKPGDGTALWRHFLATAQGFQDSTPEAMQAICGMGPILFLLGGSLYTQTEEIYAMHYVERAVVSHLTNTTSKAAQSEIGTRSQRTLDVLAAAAVGGFSASVIRQICEDIAFITSAQLLMGGDDAAALSARLDRATSNGQQVQRGIGLSPVMPTARISKSSRVEYAGSVVDSEIGAESSDIANLADFPDEEIPTFEVSGASTPRATLPVMTTETAQQIRNSAKMMRETAKKAPSEFNFMDIEETVRF